MISTWAETARTAIEALNARRMRSILTVLGILIGIASVMLTVGLGQSATSQITEQINSLGSNMLIVSPGSSSSGGFRGAARVSTLSLEDAKLLANKDIAPHIAAVAPLRSGMASLKSSSTTWTATMYGTVPDWQQVRARQIANGRFFTQAEIDSAANVLVLGPEAADELFDGRSVVGQTVLINGQSFTVIGVLTEVGSSLTGSEDNVAIIPITTFGARFSTGNVNSLDSIFMEVLDQESLSAAYQEVNKALAVAHGVTQDDKDFQLSTQAALVDAMASITGILTLVLGAIAGISLLVGGIGVMNIMLVSVSERVREIGLRKALGATPALIRRQFLVEAGVLGLTGGVLGMALGFGAAAIISAAVAMPVSISPGAAGIALGVSFGIGLVAGVYPAGRAANLAPIDALRSE